MWRWNIRHISGSALAMLAILAAVTTTPAQTTSAEQVNAAVPDWGAQKTRSRARRFRDRQAQPRRPSPATRSMPPPLTI